MERYKSRFQLTDKQWINCKLSEVITHVQEIQAITFIYNHLKQQNQNALKNKKEADTKIVIQRILGLLRDGKTIKQIVAITRESLFFVQLIKTIYDKEYFGENLNINDLKKHKGVSDFTRKFLKQRQKIKGAGNKSAKLVEMRVNFKVGYVSFIFLSEPTNTFNTKVTIPPSMKLKSDNLYTQTIRFVNFFQLLKTKPGFKTYKDITINEIKDAIKTDDIKVFCDCPSFYWMGMDYNMSQLDAAIYPTDISPKYWDNYHGSGNQLLCKHLSLLFNSIDFYVPIMTGMIYKYLQNK